MKSLAVKPKAFFPDFGSVSPSEPEHFLYGEKKEFEFRFLPGTVKTGDLLILAVDNDFNFYDANPSNLTHCAPVMCLGRHEVTAEEAAEQKVEILLETQTADFRDKTNGCVRPLVAKMGLYKWSDESYSLLAIGGAYCHPVLATYDIPLSPIIDDSYYTKEQIDEKIDAKLDKPAVQGTAGQVLSLDENGQNVWKDEQEIPEQEQANWAETDTTSPSYIQNKPDLSLYAEKSELATVATSGDYDDLSDKPDLSVYAEKSELAPVATSGDYDDLSNKPTIPTKVSDLTNDSNFQTAQDVATALQPYSLTTATGAKLSLSMDSDYKLTVGLLNSSGTALDSKVVDLPIESMIINASYANGVLTLTLQNGQTITVDISDIVSGLVPDSRTVNGHALDEDIDITASDLSLAAVAETGDYDDLSNKPVIPTDTSELTNGAGFVTAADLATVATTGDYADLSNLPTLPTQDELVPAATSSDEGKVLTVDSTGTPTWEEPQGGGEDPLDYLCFTAGQNNCTVQLDKNNSSMADLDLEYSTDKQTWNTYTWESGATAGSVITLANAGDKVYFRGNNAAFSTSSSNYYKFVVTASDTNKGGLRVDGNIMSLLDKTCQSVSIPCNYCFYRLFANQWRITSSPRLPAVDFGSHTMCYGYMFYGCSQLNDVPDFPVFDAQSQFSGSNNLFYSMFAQCGSLTKVPKFGLGVCNIPNEMCGYMFYKCWNLVDASGFTGGKGGNGTSASSVGQNAFMGMFQDCTSLVVPPTLWYNTSSASSFESMFNGCTSLVNAPELFVATKGQGCFRTMFTNCTSLVSAPRLIGGANNLCYEEMFKGCTSLVNAPELPATTAYQGCYRNMFSGCTSLKKAPSLPATTTVLNCYQSMFSGCVGVHYVRVSTTSSTNIQNMFYQAATYGVFDCPLTLDTSFLPSGWTVCHNDYDASLEPASFEIPAASTAQLLLPPTVFSHAPSAATVYTLWHDPDKAVETVRIIVDMTTTNQVSFQDENGVAIPSGTWAVGSEVEFTCTYANGGWAVVGDDGIKASPDGEDPLWVETENTSGGFLVRYSSGWTGTVEYSYDKATWTSIVLDGTQSTLYTTVPFNGHHRVYLRKDAPNSSSQGVYISGTSITRIGGNLSSMNTSYSGTAPAYEFYMLFGPANNQNTALRDISELKIPMRALGANAMSYLFRGCTVLAETMPIPVAFSVPGSDTTTYLTGSWTDAFEGCSNLVKINLTRTDTGAYIDKTAGLYRITDSTLNGVINVLDGTTYIRVNCTDIAPNGKFSATAVGLPLLQNVQARTSNNLNPGSPYVPHYTVGSGESRTLSLNSTVMAAISGGANMVYGEVIIDCDANGTVAYNSTYFTADSDPVVPGKRNWCVYRVLGDKAKMFLVDTQDLPSA